MSKNLHTITCDNLYLLLKLKTFIAFKFFVNNEID